MAAGSLEMSLSYTCTPWYAEQGDPVLCRILALYRLWPLFCLLLGGGGGVRYSLVAGLAISG